MADAMSGSPSDFAAPDGMARYAPLLAGLDAELSGMVLAGLAPTTCERKDIFTLIRDLSLTETAPASPQQDHPGAVTSLGSAERKQFVQILTTLLSRYYDAREHGEHGIHALLIQLALKELDTRRHAQHLQSEVDAARRDAMRAAATARGRSISNAMPATCAGWVDDLPQEVDSEARLVNATLWRDYYSKLRDAMRHRDEPKCQLDTLAKLGGAVGYLERECVELKCQLIEGQCKAGSIANTARGSSVPDAAGLQV
eukprot:m.36403 g.36403  ORF g.36403 m.36403 type:complete len:256 (+) comp5388_c0_seq1:609-1376(+)